MRAITVKQPWASLIVEEIKDIENRTWPTKFRGRVLIHASSSSWSWGKLINYCTQAMKIVFETLGYDTAWLKQLPAGAIIGSVEIVDCVINHKSIWAEKTTYSPTLGLAFNPIYNWVLANPIKFPEPIPVKGKLSFWDYPYILAEPEEKDGELFCHCQLSVKEENQVMSIIDQYRCRYCGGRWYK